MHHRLYLFAHVVVLVVKLERGGTCTVFGIDDTGQAFHLLLACLEAGTVVVADDIRDGGLLHFARKTYQVVEALVAFGMLRGFVRRKHGDEAVRHQHGIYHLALGGTRMDVASLECDFGGSGIEVLELKLAHFTAIHGISPLAAELRHIELMGTHADFLVRIKADADFAVLDFGMLFQIDHRGDDFGDARLVVGTEQGLAIGHNQVFALMVEQFGELGGGKDDILFGAKRDVLAVIVGHDAGFHVLAAHIGAGIHVGYEADSGDRLVGIGGKGGEEIPVLVQRDLFQSQRFQFFFQELGEHHLSRSTRGDPALFVRLRIETYILQKTFYQSHEE